MKDDINRSASPAVGLLCWLLSLQLHNNWYNPAALILGGVNFFVINARPVVARTLYKSWQNIRVSSLIKIFSWLQITICFAHYRVAAAKKIVNKLVSLKICSSLWVFSFDHVIVDWSCLWSWEDYKIRFHLKFHCVFLYW